MAFKGSEDSLDLRPAWAELFQLLGLPARQNVFGEVWGPIQESAREVEHEGAGDDRHLDDPKLVVVAEHTRDVTPADSRHAALSQP
jgi:hypothetical protein